MSGLSIGVCDLTLEYVSFSLTEKNIEQLKKLNTVCSSLILVTSVISAIFSGVQVIFPVRYADKFYNIDALRAEHEDITKLGLIH